MQHSIYQTRFDVVLSGQRYAPRKLNDEPIVRDLGQTFYEPVWRKMQTFTNNRTSLSRDELWITQHMPVFTLGQAGKREHLLVDSEIPIVATDRGGQITYHGPGQLVVYVLFDLKRRGIGVRHLVRLLEQSVLDLLASLQIQGHRVESAPGVYVDNRKIAQLGIRIKRGCSYHGLSINVDMDLAPFTMINPCGYEGLEVTQLSALGCQLSLQQVALQLLKIMNFHLVGTHRPPNL